MSGFRTYVLRESENFLRFMLTGFFNEGLQCLQVARDTSMQGSDVGDTDRWAGSADFFNGSDVSQRSEPAVASKK